MQCISIHKGTDFLIIQLPTLQSEGQDRPAYIMPGIAVAVPVKINDRLHACLMKQKIVRRKILMCNPSGQPVKKIRRKLLYNGFARKQRPAVGSRHITGKLHGLPAQGLA